MRTVALDDPAEDTASDPAESGAQALPPRSQRKREAILGAATELFLEQGYLGASVDEIASMAGVSKQTVYKHFGDKERLFAEMVTRTTSRFAPPFRKAVAAARRATSLPVALRAMGRAMMDVALEPQILRLRRLVVGEVVRFPDLGRHYFAEGPSRGIEALTEAFEDYAERGALRIQGEALRSAAAHFTWLVGAIPINRVMLLGDDARPSPEELDGYIEDAVAIFMAAYARREPTETSPPQGDPAP